MTNLLEMFQTKCIHRHTIKSHPACFNSDGTLKEYKQASLRESNVLVLDVETLPILGYSWGVWNQNIYPNQIEKDWCILSYAAKWLGDDRIISDVLSPKEALARDDERIMSQFQKLLDKSNVTISHNGKRFDIRKINTRLWKNKLHKPTSFKIIDTLVTARNVFGLTYNKLDFIAKFIEADEKLDTNFELWRQCDRGNKSALQEMKTYNEQDVYTLEEIYNNMREWIPNHPDLGIYQNLENVCPVCLNDEYKEIGLYTANRKQFPEYRCEDCGSIWHSSKAIIKKRS